MEENELLHELPENAFRELKDGEKYEPMMSPQSNYPEVNTWSVTWGVLMAVLFSAAAAYLGLKVGQVFEAAIPIAIIAVGVSTATKRSKALGENVIIQSIGACSGAVVAGAIFTLPAIYILQAKYPEMSTSFLKVFMASALGGCLGILFLIPFRKYFVSDMHGKYPFPEATATTQVLVSGAKGGDQAKPLLLAGLIGGLYDFIVSTFGWWNEVVTTRMMGWGEVLADKAKIVFKVNTSAAVLGLGYIIGLKYAMFICLGSLAVWWLIVPGIGMLFHDQVLTIGSATAASTVGEMSPEAIFTTYARSIGIGGIAMAGIIGIVKSWGIIKSAVQLLRPTPSPSPREGRKYTSAADTNQTPLPSGGAGGRLAVSNQTPFPSGGAGGRLAVSNQTPLPSGGAGGGLDLSFKFIAIASLAALAVTFVFFWLGVMHNLWFAVVSILLVAVIAFLFTTVAANAIAIVGSNPVSGMTLMTLILASVVLAAVGLSGTEGMVAALIMGGVVCTALSMAGCFITDLKIGYWIGTTPRKQESWKFLGTLVSAATVGGVIMLLNETYGFASGELAAPQANAMAAVIEPVMNGEGAPWVLYAIGAVIALVLTFCKIPALPVALGMFIPLQLNIPLLVGGAVNWFVTTRSKNKVVNAARGERGTLIASGFIAGGALMGVVSALMRFGNLNFVSEAWMANPLSEFCALVAYVLLIGYFVYASKKGAKSS